MQILQEYIAALQQQYATLRATEDSYRPELMNFLKSLWGKSFLVQNDPRQTLFGKPDLHIWKDGAVIGYIETKTLDADLDSNEHKEQFTRYQNGFANLIITNFLEFRLYSRGKLVATTSIARLTKRGNQAVITLDQDGIERTFAMFKAFIEAFDHTIADPAQLVSAMAALTQLIRENIRRALRDAEHGSKLREQFEGFREELLPNLAEEDFADVYAQTICFGLFAARCNAPDNQRFTYRDALYDLPKTNPFLRGLFNELAGIDIDFTILWAAEDLAVMLSRADMHEILKGFGKDSSFNDPIIHFYETFLAAYNPELRRARGVYYTPPPVVSYIVRSVDDILKSRFRLRKGLTDTTKIPFTNPQTKQTEQIHKVLILDPAVGTGAFLHEVVRRMYEDFTANQGQWSSYVAKHLLPRVFGFELLVAPYAIAHLHVDRLLAETGYDFAADERLQVYLTNTLDKPETALRRLPFAQWLSKETKAAHRIKQDIPVMVILGNPPYAGHSANPSTEKSVVGKGELYTSKYKLALSGRLEAVQRRATRTMDIEQRTYIGELIERYKFVDGKPLGEKNSKWLQDDYVKFIRLAQHRIEQTGFGVLAFITNNGYLDNPTFRGMRHSLLETFDEIYLYDLHGSSKKKETAPDGSPDENVFDIQQGVSIGIFVKHETPATAQIHAAQAATSCRVFHADLFGKREGKYNVLAASSVGTMEQNKEWSELQPTAPFYLFVPQNTDLRAEYEQAWKISESMPHILLGPNSHRDEFAVAFTFTEAQQRIENLKNLSISNERIKQLYNISDNRDWKLHKARNLEELHHAQPTPCIYRPFDFRFMLYGKYAFDYPRPEINDHLLKANLAIIVTRQTKEDFAVWITNKPAGQHKLATPYDGSYIVPLYRYPSGEEGMFAAAERTANFAPKFVEALEATLDRKLGADFTPEDVLYWCYAVLHSSDYRARYAEFLKIDFPRVPLTASWAVWQRMTAFGKLLVETHLMERTDLAETVTYPERGTNTVIAPNPKWEDERVYINPTQYFGGVREEIWEMTIGGYQPAEKWLKDRKGRELSYDDIEHYRRVIASLEETMRLTDVIDEYVLSLGGVAGLLAAEGA